MTPSEFKSWFDGFTEAFENRIPTKAQWARVKERVAEIDGKPVTERVYIDRYYQRYFTTPSVPLPYYTPWYGTSTLSTNCGAQSLASNTQNLAFDSRPAMTALGRAEAMSLGAAQ